MMIWALRNGNGNIQKYYLAAAAFFAALVFAASDIFFRVSAETVLFFAGVAAFTDAVFDGADFFATVTFFAGTAVFAAFLAVRVYFRFCGPASWLTPIGLVTDGDSFTSESRIFVTRSISVLNRAISLFSSLIALSMLILPPIEQA
jgi:hypothetical protein